MCELDKLLEYIQRTNPEMTKERLIYELGQHEYSSKSLLFTANGVNIQNNNCGNKEDVI